MTSIFRQNQIIINGFIIIEQFEESNSTISEEQKDEHRNHIQSHSNTLNERQSSCTFQQKCVKKKARAPSQKIKNKDSNNNIQIKKHVGRKRSAPLPSFTSHLNEDDNSNDNTDHYLISKRRIDSIEYESESETQSQNDSDYEEENEDNDENNSENRSSNVNSFEKRIKIKNKFSQRNSVYFINKKRPRKRLINLLLKRWWYAWEWPPRYYSSTALLEEHKLRVVQLSEWKREPNVYPDGFKKCLELPGKRHVYSDSDNLLFDFRPSEDKPSFSNVSTYSQIKLCNLTILAIENYIKEVSLSELSNIIVFKEAKSELRFAQKCLKKLLYDESSLI